VPNQPHDHLELVACLLFTNCYDEAVKNRARLEVISKINGGQAALKFYFLYIDRFQRGPSFDEFTAFVESFTQAHSREAKDDLGTIVHQAYKDEKAVFHVVLDQAERNAQADYIKIGMYEAARLADGHTDPGDFHKRHLVEMYGKDAAGWNLFEYSQVWLHGYLAKNPYVANAAAEDQGDKVVASSEVLSGDDKFVTKNIYAVGLDEIQERELLWLWEDKIPLGKVTWFVGRPQNGKSMSGIDLIARVTTGRDWPDGKKNEIGPANVYGAFSEDELPDTIKPRLRAAGADLSRVKVFTRTTEDGCNRPVDLVKDIADLEKLLLADPSFKLLLFDPLPSFLADVNLNVSAEARPVMDSLKLLCERTGVALLGIIHENKRTDVTAIHKIPGDASVAGVARMAWAFSRDSDDKEKFRMSLVKGNITKKRNGLSFGIEDKELDGLKRKQPYIVWGDEISEDADDVINSEREERYGKRDDKMSTLARIWLPEALKNGPRTEKDLTEAAALQEGISKWQLRRVKSELGIVSTRRGKEWWWSLPVEEKQMEAAMAEVAL